MNAFPCHAESSGESARVQCQVPGRVEGPRHLPAGEEIPADRRSRPRERVQIQVGGGMEAQMGLLNTERSVKSKFSAARFPSIADLFSSTLVLTDTRLRNASGMTPPGWTGPRGDLMHLGMSSSEWKAVYVGEPARYESPFRGHLSVAPGVA